MSGAPTFVTRLTPAGRAAIATILVRGPIAITSLERHFEPCGSKQLRDLPLNRIVYGAWSARENSKEGVVLCRTSDDAVELNCHGGQAAADSIVSGLQSAGCQLVEWALLAGADSIQRECVVALADARTATVATILLDQHRGALHRAFQEIQQSLADGNVAEARRQVTILGGFRSLGLHLTKPWRVVLAGAPNVGKSSLINSLVGFQRAIVYDQPGTTRDVVTAQTVIDGWLVEFADTAGIRQTDEPVEAAGVQQSVDCLRDADLIVQVLDAASTQLPREQLGDLTKVLSVFNKIDQQPSMALPIPADSILTSALTGEGVEHLLGEIGSRLVPQSPPSGAAVPFTERQYAELDRISLAMEDGEFEAANQSLARLVDVAPIFDS